MRSSARKNKPSSKSWVCFLALAFQFQIHAVASMYSIIVETMMSKRKQVTSGTQHWKMPTASCGRKIQPSASKTPNSDRFCLFAIMSIVWIRFAWQDIACSAVYDHSCVQCFATHRKSEINVAVAHCQPHNLTRLQQGNCWTPLVPVPAPAHLLCQLRMANLNHYFYQSRVCLLRRKKARVRKMRRGLQTSRKFLWTLHATASASFLLLGRILPWLKNVLFFRSCQHSVHSVV